MKKTISFKELAEEVLKEVKKPLTTMEIWNFAKEKGYDKLVGSEGKTPWNTIGARIYVDMRENPNTPFIKVNTKPVKFSIKGIISEQQLKNLVKRDFEKVVNNSKYSERELHPFLTYFTRMYMGVYTKTIFHEKSHKKRYTQWLHPDMVGVSFPNWLKDVLELTKSLGNPNIKLFSFEIKKYLNFTNLREAFFQTVSNSSWSNEAYLVSVEISEDQEFMEELQRLSNSFGIGIIKLDISDPNLSKILFPAKKKPYVDWDTVNKLCEENSDFRTFIEGIHNDIKTNEIRFERYDKLLEHEKLVKTIKRRDKYGKE